MELAEKGGQTMSVLLSITKTRSRLRHTLLYTAPHCSTLLHTHPVLQDALNGFSIEREESRNCDWIKKTVLPGTIVRAGGSEALCLPLCPDATHSTMASETGGTVQCHWGTDAQRHSATEAGLLVENLRVSPPLPTVLMRQNHSRPNFHLLLEAEKKKSSTKRGSNCIWLHYSQFHSKYQNIPFQVLIFHTMSK